MCEDPMKDCNCKSSPGGLSHVIEHLCGFWLRLSVHMQIGFCRGSYIHTVLFCSFSLVHLVSFGYNQMYVFFFNLKKIPLGICGWATHHCTIHWKNPPYDRLSCRWSTGYWGWVTKVTFPRNPPYPTTWVHTHTSNTTWVHCIYIPTYLLRVNFFYKKPVGILVQTFMSQFFWIFFQKHCLLTAGSFLVLSSETCQFLDVFGNNRNQWSSESGLFPSKNWKQRFFDSEVV